MSDYDNTNSGALFKNEKKENEKQPDYKGPLNVNGEELEVAAWLKTAQSGKKYMSLSVQPKWVPDGQKQEVVQEEFEDDIPF